MDWAQVSRDVIERDELPQICIVCGLDATTKVHKNFDYRPEWIEYLYLAGFFPGMIADYYVSQRVRVACPVCDEHRGHWSKLVWFASLGWLLAVVMGGIGFGIASMLDFAVEEALWGVLVGSLIGIVVYVGILIRLVLTRVNVTRITHQEVRFERVSDEFARQATSTTAATGMSPSPLL